MFVPGKWMKVRTSQVNGLVHALRVIDRDTKLGGNVDAEYTTHQVMKLMDKKVWMPRSMVESCVSAALDLRREYGEFTNPTTGEPLDKMLVVIEDNTWHIDRETGLISKRKAA